MGRGRLEAQVGGADVVVADEVPGGALQDDATVGLGDVANYNNSTL